MKAASFVGSITEDKVEQISCFVSKDQIQSEPSNVGKFFIANYGYLYHKEPQERNLNHNCTGNVFGQLRNDDLFLPLRPGKYRSSNCYHLNKERFECAGDIPIQDFAPTYFSVSFGFVCESDSFHQKSLKGLQFNITIYELANVTKCTEMIIDHPDRI